MADELKTLFVSYSRQDSDDVRPIVEAVDRELAVLDTGVRTWMDITGLQPGMSWEVEIRRALESAIGQLVFVSPASIYSRSVLDEVHTMSQLENRLIIPVLLHPVDAVPHALRERYWVDLRGIRTHGAIDKAANEIANAVAEYVASAPKRSASTAAPPELTASIAERARSAQAKPAPSPEPPSSVFIVHGHDEKTLDEVVGFLEGVGVESVVLQRIGGQRQSLLQKFLEFSTKARFAIVLLTADDLGSARRQYDADGVGDKSLMFRARQNVILELGFFYGQLGFESVFVLWRKPDKVFPNFERPSDIDGVVFDTIDDTGQWKEALAKKLRDAKFAITPAP